MELKTLYRKLHLLYFRYKDSPYFSVSLYGVVIVISLIITVSIIVPQVQSWVSLQDEIRQTRERVQILRTNAQFLRNMDTLALENDFTIVSTAYPPQRDVSLLIAAINDASVQSGVSLGDFSFQLAEGPSVGALDGSDTTSLISFTVQGGFPEIVRLIGQLEQKLPLLVITNIDAQFLSANTAQVTVAYFSEPFPLIPKGDANPLKDIPPQGRELLQKLRGWQVPVVDLTSVSGSDGAELLPL